MDIKQANFREKKIGGGILPYIQLEEEGSGRGWDSVVGIGKG